MKILDKRQILNLHKVLIQKFGGVDGIRDENLLDSAIYSPFQTFEGNDLYPSVIDKAARLGFGLIKNHPFIDGNKRIGTHSMLVLLEANDFFVECEDEELIKTIFQVADNTLNYLDFLKWLNDHIAVNEGDSQQLKISCNKL